jgi:hypothetical protein
LDPTHFADVGHRSCDETAGGETVDELACEEHRIGVGRLRGYSLDGDADEEENVDGHNSPLATNLIGNVYGL